MSQAKKSRYHSPVREQQAAQTRDRVATAAAELFVRHGYGPTSVSAVARHADVSAQTVYNTFGTKAALLKAAYDVTLVGDTEPVPLAERADVRALYAETDPTTFLLGYAALGRRVLDRVGPLMLQIAAGAAAGDPDLIERRAVTDRERLVGTTMVARRVAELGGLSAQRSIEGARDRIWTLNSAEVWHLLTGTLGWGGDDYQAWIGEAMCAAVLSR